MDFTLTDEQNLLRDSIERFVRAEYDFERRRAIVESDEGWSPALWRQFGEFGWNALPFAEADGGLGGGPIETMLLMEQFGRGLVVEPWLSSVVLTGGVLARAGDETQKARWLAPVMAGESTAALAFAEPAGGYDPAWVTTRAERDRDGWRLTGRKQAVLGGAGAAAIVVPARTSGEPGETEGITLFVAPPDAEGLSLRSYPTVDGFRAADIELEGVAVGDEMRLGDPDAGGAALSAAIGDGLLAVSAEAVGIMTTLLEKTVEYARSRVQFGRPIGSFQALQHRMVDMLMSVEQTRSLLLAAVAKTAAEDPDAARLRAALKYQVGRAGRHVGQEAVQLHGGMGVTLELDVPHYFKRLTMIDTLFGNADYHLDRFL